MARSYGAFVSEVALETKAEELIQFEREQGLPENELMNMEEAKDVLQLWLQIVVDSHLDDLTHYVNDDPQFKLAEKWRRRIKEKQG